MVMEISLKRFCLVFLVLPMISFKLNGLIDKKTLIEHVKKSISTAENGMSQLPPEILAIDGMSSSKVRHFLNNVCSLPQASYLEIGVWKGSTFISALYGNKQMKNAIAIDNWSEFGDPAEQFMGNTKKWLSNSSFMFYDQDCFKINKKTIFNNKVNIYFYDGNHARESQKLAFTYFNDIFEDTFIAIVDDWNWPQVAAGTDDAFKNLKYKILFEAKLFSAGDADRQNWWNGLYVAVISKQ